jgi:hypothetical protein
MQEKCKFCAKNFLANTFNSIVVRRYVLPFNFLLFRAVPRTFGSCVFPRVLHSLLETMLWTLSCFPWVPAISHFYQTLSRLLIKHPVWALHGTRISVRYSLWHFRIIKDGVHVLWETNNSALFRNWPYKLMCKPVTVAARIPFKAWMLVVCTYFVFVLSSV